MVPRTGAPTSRRRPRPCSPSSSRTSNGSEATRRCRRSSPTSITRESRTQATESPIRSVGKRGARTKPDMLSPTTIAHAASGWGFARRTAGPRARRAAELERRVCWANGSTCRGDRGEIGLAHDARTSPRKARVRTPRRRRLRVLSTGTPRSTRRRMTRAARAGGCSTRSTASGRTARRVRARAPAGPPRGARARMASASSTTPDCGAGLYRADRPAGHRRRLRLPHGTHAGLGRRRPLVPLDARDAGLSGTGFASDNHAGAGGTLANIRFRPRHRHRGVRRGLDAALRAMARTCARVSSCSARLRFRGRRSVGDLGVAPAAARQLGGSRARSPRRTPTAARCSFSKRIHPPSWRVASPTRSRATKTARPSMRPNSRRCRPSSAPCSGVRSAMIDRLILVLRVGLGGSSWSPAC